MISRINKRSIVTAVAATVGAAIATPAMAQLEEVIVTATKREQTLQDIPISIQAISGEFVDEFNMTDIQDIAGTVPNVIIGYGITAQSVNIRGLGSGQDRSFEQSVGMFIDGVYLPRSRQYRNPFFDIERVEIMRGPQSVVHGLNSTAGAISVLTRRNEGGDPFEASIMADTELEYGGYGVTATAGGGLTDSFGLRAAVRASDYDGFMMNNVNGEESTREDMLVRLNAVWNLSDSVALTGKFETSEYESSLSVGEIYGGISNLLEPNDGVLNWQHAVDESTIDIFGILPVSEPGIESQYDLYSLGLEWELGNNRIDVLVARSEFEYDISLDLDTTTLNIIDAGIDEDYEQTSVEARISSQGDNTIDYIAGIYYHDTSLRNAQPNIYGEGALGPGVGLESTGIFEVDSTLFSPFVQATWNLSDTFRISGGGRYSDEEKDVFRDSRCNLGLIGSATLVPAPPPLAAALCPSADLDGYTDSRTSSNFMWELAAQWDLSESTMLYAKASDSAKAGGFSSSTSAQRGQLEYDDESALGLEAGIKARSAGGSFEWNLSIFRTEFDDLQVNSFDVEIVDGVVSTRPRITNAAEAISQGLEADARWSAADWLTLGASVGLLDAEYDKFTEGNCNSAITSPTGVCDLSGQSLPYAPDMQATFYGDLRAPLFAGMDLTGGFTVAYSDDYLTEGTIDPLMMQDSYTRVDAHIGIAGRDDMWSISVIGKNLTEEEILGSSQGFGTYFLGYLEPPRTIFIRATLNFGG